MVVLCGIKMKTETIGTSGKFLEILEQRLEYLTMWEELTCVRQNSGNNKVIFVSYVPFFASEDYHFLLFCDNTYLSISLSV